MSPSPTGRGGDGRDDDWLSRVNTAIVSPDGAVLAGPLTEQAGTLVATIDLATLVLARRELDCVGVAGA